MFRTTGSSAHHASPCTAQSAESPDRDGAIGAQPPTIVGQDDNIGREGPPRCAQSAPRAGDLAEQPERLGDVTSPQSHRSVPSPKKTSAKKAKDQRVAITSLGLQLGDVFPASSSPFQVDDRPIVAPDVNRSSAFLYALIDQAFGRPYTHANMPARSSACPPWRRRTPRPRQPASRARVTAPVRCAPPRAGRSARRRVSTESRAPEPDAQAGTPPRSRPHARWSRASRRPHHVIAKSADRSEAEPDNVQDGNQVTFISSHRSRPPLSRGPRQGFSVEQQLRRARPASVIR